MGGPIRRVRQQAQNEKWTAVTEVDVPPLPQRMIGSRRSPLQVEAGFVVFYERLLTPIGGDKQCWKMWFWNDEHGRGTLSAKTSRSSGQTPG